jgi:hypothetical protein
MEFSPSFALYYEGLFVPLTTHLDGLTGLWVVLDFGTAFCSCTCVAFACFCLGGLSISAIEDQFLLRSFAFCMLLCLQLGDWCVKFLSNRR